MKFCVKITLLFILVGGVLYAAEKYPIVLTLKAPFETSTVHVAGDFNNWSTTENPLIYSSEKDIWETRLSLEPGRYEYRFVINGMNWIKDPANPHWGGTNSNSILFVETPGTPELKDLEPETGEILHENSFRINAEYWSGIEKNDLSASESAILLDNIPLKVEYFAQRNTLRGYTANVDDGVRSIKINAVDSKGNNARQVSRIVIVNENDDPPLVEAGYTIIAGVGENVTLNTGTYYDPDIDPITNYDWRIISKPEGSKSKIKNSDTPFPNFKPDKVGRFVFGLKIEAGYEKSVEDTMDVYAFVRRNYPTEFRFPDSTYMRMYESQVDCVYVVGEFNNWSTTGNRMTDYDNDGVWTAWVDLDPGQYEYKYFVNNQHWMADPLEPKKVMDGWSGYNSIKDVTLNLAPFIEVNASFRPGKMLFDASESYSKTGKKLNFYWYQDINNPERFDLQGDLKLEIPIPRKEGGYYYYLIASDSFGSSSQKTIVLKVKDRKVKIQDFSESPAWANDAIIYEIFVKRFTQEGTLKGVVSKLQYLKSLGINCIWLMPVFRSPTENKYGPTDFYQVDPEYGTEADLKELIEKAHNSGIRVILDYIGNHTSDQHPFFLSAFQNKFSAFRDWYNWYPEDNSRVFYQYEFYNDWDRLPNLNFDNPNVRKYMFDVAEYWLELGADGYRCDVAWGVPHDFWKLFRRHIKKLNPEFLLLNETLPRSPDYHDDEFDMSYDTDFYGNLLDVMSRRKPITAIEYGLNKTELNYPPNTQNLRYLENHDMERFISQFSIAQTKLAATLLFTIPGTPLILYGQEYGARDRLPEMDWSKTSGDYFNFTKKLIQLRRKYPALRTGEMIKVPTNQEEQVYAYLRRNEQNTFLIVLNMVDKRLDCQLLLKEVKFKNRKIYFDELITGVRQNIKKVSSNKIVLELQPEKSYIYIVL
ncbi:hypothetical protein GF337_00225 [candidate division KSB1 bacterium]|nr:hypothetical protein [candidate division KSB1 bacterium]